VIEVPAQAGVAAGRRRALPLSERRLVLTAVDLVAVAAAFVAAFNLHSARVQGVGFSIPRLGTAVVCGLWLLASRLANADDVRSVRDARTTVRAVGTALVLTFLGMLLVVLAAPYRITRPTMLLWVPLAGVGVLSGRLVCRRVLANDTLATRIVLVISGEALRPVWSEVASNLGTLYRVVGIVDPAEADAGERLWSLTSSRLVDQIVLGVRDQVSRDLFRDLLRCHEAGASVRSLADLYEELTGRLLLDQLGHTWLMALPMRNETSRLYAAVKRATDVLVASVVLALSLPLLPALAAAIWIDDRGPVFFRQVRVGQYGRPFEIVKLRTMRRDTTADGHWTNARDPRVTRVGRWLRRLHLDELPQAWSILRGDMSLVGPRPEQPHYVERLRQAIDFYGTRLSVRPGLTGWAQVNYGYGDGIDGARIKLSYDLYYIKRQSVSLDLLILGRTALTVLSLGGR
jgi:exopolysaccharide biosynthesis polyprenyl glycosylphosphotransferase